MSTTRFARGLRNMGLVGGTSRLSRPPAVLEEPDVKPGRVETCFTAVFASRSGGGDSTVRIAWNRVTSGCGVTSLALGFEEATLPPGTYQIEIVTDRDGMQATVDWTSGFETASTLTNTLSFSVTVPEGEEGIFSVYDSIDTVTEGPTSGTLSICCQDVGVYRIYAVGQSLSSGSNATLDWDGATESSSGNIDIALEAGVITVHEAGIYSAVAHVVYGGSVGASKHATIDVFDNVASGSTGQVTATGNPFDFTSADGTSPYGFNGAGKITLPSPDGFFFLSAGPGIQVGTTITSATYIEITKHP